MGESIETPGMTFLRRLDIAKENKNDIVCLFVSNHSESQSVRRQP